jgi:hypothetical protein
VGTGVTVFLVVSEAQKVVLQSRSSFFRRTRLAYLVTADAYKGCLTLPGSKGLGYRLRSTNHPLLPLAAGKINIIERIRRTSIVRSLFLRTRARRICRYPLESRKVNPR